MSEAIIVSNPRIQLGQPSIRGTRITVVQVLEEVAAGLNTEQILQKYPHLSEESLQAALHFAMQAVRSVSAPPLPSSML